MRFLLIITTLHVETYIQPYLHVETCSTVKFEYIRLVHLYSFEQCSLILFSNVFRLSDVIRNVISLSKVII